MNEAERAAEQVAAVENQVRELAARTGPVLGRASSSDGAVTVVAAAGGPPQSIQVAPFALRMGPQALGQEIVRVAQQASREAAAQLHRTVGHVVPAAELSALGFEEGGRSW
ncbi:hypothetical protein Lesp02_25050 [Lentzea sp. NBRC 105346]|uniref:YbaB/EbfC family nucleoid-associated protein n=1 Tax=Lentzea sp. NBRC 105346 TaxID=3032205 RepID=UPI002553496E|nr:YbaB/EbfC family nucleoid-associated protein [Lentzea sp. NBRC 105346]GLZ30316.1 hypothetical protein Lesp02_25050 [Lentzea sp. NBRC 105346]